MERLSDFAAPIPPPVRFKVQMKLRSQLAAPARREASRRFAGYALIEPA